MKFRQLKSSEIPFLKEMFYEALFVPEGQPPFPKSIIDEPDLAKYIENWGSKEFDLAIVAEIKSELIGAIWGRIFQPPKIGYGFIDAETPEISMAIKAEFRGKGIGTQLIERISTEYATKNIKALSLSVDKLNRVVGLYERRGFEIVEEVGTAWTMRKKL